MPDINENVAARVEQLKCELRELWLHGRERRIAIGTRLLELHALLAKQGTGKFMETVAQLGIPYTTGRDYMTEASCYESRNNELPETQEPAADTVGEPQVGEANDQQAEQVRSAVASERTARERLEEDQQYSDIFRVDFRPVTPPERDACKQKIRQVGIAEAFRRFYRALFS